MFGSKKRVAEAIAAAEKQAREQVLQQDPARGLENARRLRDRARERDDRPSQAYWAIIVDRYKLAKDEQDVARLAEKTAEDTLADLRKGVIADLRKAAINTAALEADRVHLQTDAAKSIRTIDKVLKAVDPQETPSNYAYFARLRERYEEKLAEQERALMGVQTHTPVDEVETAAEISEEASPGETPEAEVRRLRRALAARTAGLVAASERVSEARAEIRDLKAVGYAQRMAVDAARAAQRKAEQERTRSAAKAYKKGYARGKKNGVAIGERQGAVVEKARNLISQRRIIHDPPTSATIRQWVDEMGGYLRARMETVEPRGAGAPADLQARRAERTRPYQGTSVCANEIRINKATVALPDPAPGFEVVDRGHWSDALQDVFRSTATDGDEPQKPETD